MERIERLIRANIRSLVPYASAKDEYQGSANILLDANENSIGSVIGNYNRYPDPYQLELKRMVSERKGVETDMIFLGNGSDECIDILYRCCCEPGADHVIICPPTYGMYAVSAAINNVAVRSVPLDMRFQLRVPQVLAAIDQHTKIIWLCSPNNPSGNVLRRSDMLAILQSFDGLVVVDEAYIDFAAEHSCISLLRDYHNLVVLQTFSKGWGLAGLRLGVAYAHPSLLHYMNKVKPPYNINQATQTAALAALSQADVVAANIKVLIAARVSLQAALLNLPQVQRVFPSDANFLLVQLERPRELYQYLLNQGTILRDRSTAPGCTGCLRITVGTPTENNTLIQQMQQFYSKS